MQRLARIAGSFAIVLVAYWVYAHTAVPLIEPSVKGAAGGDWRRGSESAQVGEEFYRQGVAGAFSARRLGNRQAKPPMILDINNRAKLLFRKYENAGRRAHQACIPARWFSCYDGPAENEEERLRQVGRARSARRRHREVRRPDRSQAIEDRSADRRRTAGQDHDSQRRQIARPGGRSADSRPRLGVERPRRDLRSSGRFSVGQKRRQRQRPAHQDSRPAIRIRPPSTTVRTCRASKLFEMRKIDRLHLEGNPNKPPSAVAANSASGGPPCPQPKSPGDRRRHRTDRDHLQRPVSASTCRSAWPVSRTTSR